MIKKILVFLLIIILIGSVISFFVFKYKKNNDSLDSKQDVSIISKNNVKVVESASTGEVQNKIESAIRDKLNKTD